MVLAELHEGKRAAIKQQAAQLLMGHGLQRHIGTVWNSDLWDHLPKALSRVTGRPLHIYSANVRRWG